MANIVILVTRNECPFELAGSSNHRDSICQMTFQAKECGLLRGELTGENVFELTEYLDYLK